MRNVKRRTLKEEDWLLAELLPKDELNVYSVPDHFDSKVASEKTLEAIIAFASLNSSPLRQMNSCLQSFQAYLQNQSELSLCHVFQHYSRHSPFDLRPAPSPGRLPPALKAQGPSRLIVDSGGCQG